jgi:hypothetical protein
MEHRFYGQSNPYPNLDESSLELLTVDQAIKDNTYFAQNVKLPWDGAQGPSDAPWILVGGSYPGALTAWTMAADPTVFFAGLASSAVVQTQTDFWEYFEPIRKLMPRNCSADVHAVIEYTDSLLTASPPDPNAISALKNAFGRGGFSNADFAGSLRWDLWTWQSQNVWTGYGPFNQFCDALEVDNGQVAGEGGWGLDHAIRAWGAYDSSTNAVEARQNPVDDATRSWLWQV